MEVTGFDIPAGVGVTVKTKEIPAKGKGTFEVTVNPALLESGDFVKTLKVTTTQVLATGEKVTKESIYLLKGKK
jgi:hypothetical protein